jgi:chorismate mutase
VDIPGSNPATPYRRDIRVPGRQNSDGLCKSLDRPRDEDDRIARQHEFIGELDDSLISLILRRMKAMQDLEGLRRAVGAPRVELSRENEVLRHYYSALGRSGTSLALALFELSRADALRTPETSGSERPGRR